MLRIFYERSLEIVMKLFNWLKMKKEDRPNNPVWTDIKPRTEAQTKDIKTTAALYQHRIDNLNEELEKLSDLLCVSELDMSTSRALRTKQTDTIVRRMTLLRYEIDIREGLLKWLLS